MNLLKEFPYLYKKSEATDKISVTVIQAYYDDVKHIGYIYNIHGFTDGKKQTDIDEITQGKNIGKKNETSVKEQTLSEAESKWTKQKDRKGYTENSSGVNETEVIRVMLASKYVERKHKIDYKNAFVQPKYNGGRNIAVNKLDSVIYQSREGKYFTTLSHLDSDIKKLGLEKLDGEIYYHGIPLQDLMSLLKKYQDDPTKHGIVTEDLEYWVYDIPDKTKTFKERNEILCKAFRDNPETKYYQKLKVYRLGKVIYVPTYKVENEADVDKYMKMILDDGYEGAIIRNGDAVYQHRRTDDLQKYKVVFDDEFEIVGGYEIQTGRMKGSCVFKCKTKEGKEFDVNPKGSIEQKRRYWKELNSLIGKKLTVEYREITTDGKPFHAVGICVRDYE